MSFTPTTLILASLLLISCNAKDKNDSGSPVPITPPVTGSGNISNPVAVPVTAPLSAQGCSAFYLTHSEIEIAVSCENGNLWVLGHDGNFTYDSDYNIAELLNHVYVNPSDSYVCSDEEMLINGSFEDGHNLGSNQWATFEYLNGWEVDRDVSNAPIEIQNGNSIGGLAASHGSAKLELDSHNGNGFTKSNAYVYQEIRTTKNRVYQISLDYSARVNNNASTNRVAVYWNGKKVASLNNSQVGWETFELTVLGEDEVSVIAFQSLGSEDTLGGYIDDVSVKEVCPKDI